MTIAIISMIRDSWGGSEELWYEMAKEALENGHKVMHLSYEHGPLHPKMKELISKGLISYQRPGYIRPGSGKLSRFIQMTINFFRKKADRSFEKIFVKQPNILLYNGTAYSVKDEKKLIDKIQLDACNFFLMSQLNDGRINTLPVGEKEVISQAYKLAKKVFFVSWSNLKNAEQVLGEPVPNALVVRNPVNMQEKTIIPFPADAKVQMAMVGNLITVHKGQDIALNALAQMQWKQRDWHLNIYGGGPDEHLLKDMCKALRIEDHVTFHGKVNDIRKVWQQNHLLLMPSRMEGMPLAIVEAMICGRPCVVTDVGGITEWISEEETGFIAYEVTVDAVAAAMEKAWENRNNWVAMGIAAHNRAMALYDPQPGKTLLNLMTDN